MPQIAKEVKLFFNWKLVKNPKVSGHTNVEVFIKIKMVFYDFWNKVKAPMLKWMKANRVFMKPCRGLTSQELVKIGVLGLGNPFMNRTVLADLMTKTMQAAMDQQSDEWLAEQGADRNVKCFVDISVAKVGTAYEDRNFGIEKGLVVSY